MADVEKTDSQLAREMQAEEFAAAAGGNDRPPDNNNDP
jgi:hypothetical protein